MKTLITKIQIDPTSGDMIVPLPQEVIDAWQLDNESVLGCVMEGDSIIVYRTNQEDLNNG